MLPATPRVPFNELGIAARSSANYITVNQLATKTPETGKLRLIQFAVQGLGMFAVLPLRRQEPRNDELCRQVSLACFVYGATESSCVPSAQLLKKAILSLLRPLLL